MKPGPEGAATAACRNGRGPAGARPPGPARALPGGCTGTAVPGKTPAVGRGCPWQRGAVLGTPAARRRGHGQGSRAGRGKAFEVSYCSSPGTRSWGAREPPQGS